MQESGHRAGSADGMHGRGHRAGSADGKQSGHRAGIADGKQSCHRAGRLFCPPPVLSLLASPRPRALGVEGSPKSTSRRRPRASCLPPPLSLPSRLAPQARGCARRGRARAHTSDSKKDNSPAGARSAAARANVHVLCAHQTRSPRATCTFCAPTKLVVGRHKTWETALAVLVRPRAWWHGRSRTGVVARA